MENNQPKELTLGEIVKQVLKHKILIVAITLIIAIVGTVFVGVMPNKNQKYWSSTFQLTLPEDGGFNLPKNQAKNYKTIVSLDNLKEVKASNEQYKNINVEKIVENGAISISIDKEQVNLQTEIVYIEEYTIKVDCNYFDNINVASKFVNDIIVNAFDISEALQQEKQNYFANYGKLTDSETKLDFIEAGLEDVIYSYESAIIENGNVEVNGKSLLSHKQDVLTFIANGELDQLRMEIGSADFDAKLSDYMTDFTEIIDTYYQNVASFQNDRIYVEYTDSVILSVKGVRSLIVVAGASAVLGVIAGCCLACGIEYIKNRKNQKEKEDQENA